VGGGLHVPAGDPGHLVGAAVVEIASALRHQGPGFFATPDFARYLVGAAVAGIVGYMTIGFLIRMVSPGRSTGLRSTVSRSGWS
jgi:hypothetical protein